MLGHFELSHRPLTVAQTPSSEADLAYEIHDSRQDTAVKEVIQVATARMALLPRCHRPLCIFRSIKAVQGAGGGLIVA